MVISIQNTGSLIIFPTNGICSMELFFLFICRSSFPCFNVTSHQSQIINGIIYSIGGVQQYVKQPLLLKVLIKSTITMNTEPPSNSILKKKVLTNY